MQTPKLSSEHLRLFRSHFGLTQAQAASLLGISRVTWNRYESGRHSIPGHMLHTLRGVVHELKEQAVLAQESTKERQTLGL